MALVLKDRVKETSATTGTGLGDGSAFFPGRSRTEL